MLVITMRAVAARYDVAIWVGRAPTTVNRADPAARNQQLSFETGTGEDLDTLDELFCFRGFLRMMGHAE